MSGTLALHSRPLAIELHRLLVDLEAAHWRRAIAARVRRRSVEIEAHVSSLLGRAKTEASEAGVADAQADSESLSAELSHIGDLLRRGAPAKELAGEEARSAWKSYRDELRPAYERLATALRAWAVSVPPVRKENRARSLFHFTSATVALLLFEVVFSATGSRIAVCIFAGTFWSLELLRRIVPGSNEFLVGLFRHIVHPHERHAVNSSTWYATALVILAFTQRPMVTAVALAVLGTADPAAAFIGRRFGRIRLVHGRSLEGTLTFAVVAFGAAVLVLQIFHGTLPLATTLLMALGAAISGALTELLTRRLDDNFTVPLAAAAGAWLGLLVAGG